MGWAAAGASFLHVVVVLGLLLLPQLLAWLPFLRRPPPPAPPPATIEMIEENTPNVGSSHATRAARADAKQTPARNGGAPPVISSPAAKDSVAASPDLEAEAPSPAAPPRTAPEEAQDSVDAPEVNLDLDPGPPGSGLVEGRDIIPVSPDAAHPNLPPSYPRAAAERGEQGTVGIIIDIAPDGRPADVTLASSSGSSTLDQAALRAVRRWHFRPAMKDGKPVPSVFNQQITFELEARP